MPMQRQQNAHQVRHYAPPLPEAHSTLQNVTGFRSSSVWIVPARLPRCQALDGSHARNWEER